jgi:hypothetical protein
VTPAVFIDEPSHDSEGKSLKGCEKFVPEVLVLSERLEGESIESRGRVVLEVRIPAEQLEGEEIPKEIPIFFKNKRDVDVTDDAPFYRAMEKALFDPIALPVVAYPDVILFQTRENGIVNGHTEVLSAVTTNNVSVRTGNCNSLCVKRVIDDAEQPLNVECVRAVSNDT